MTTKIRRFAVLQFWEEDQFFQKFGLVDRRHKRERTRMKDN